MEKMKKCKVCGADIAKSAKACPQCGAKNKKPIFKKWWFWVIVFIIAVGAVAGGGDKPANAPAKQEEAQKPDPVVVSVADLMSALDTNPLNASKTYKGAYVEATGYLANIDSDGKYITLAPKSNGIALPPVMCYITEKQVDTVAGLQIGQEITVTGEINDVGEVIGYSLDADAIK